jgi:alpha-ribazole phosphatase/probable phosphoglycerate mutase
VSVTIIFESHSTSVDNESGVSSGHHDCPLSALGREQARELGERYADGSVEAVYCSDLRRSWETGEIAFGKSSMPIRQDRRLRECDYGDHTQQESSKTAEEAPTRIDAPFPGGESYEGASRRILAFLIDVARCHPDGHIMVIGHRATQYGLEHWLVGVELSAAITSPWKWQPGWRYSLAETAEDWRG